jgi:hypothetical protein
MTTPATLADGTKLRYGFGLSLADIRGHRAIFHGGGINGFLSEAEYYPDGGLSIVVLLNTAGPVNPGDLAADIADALLGKVDQPTRSYPGDLTAFAGTYEGIGRGRPSSVTVTVENGSLTLKGGGAEARTLAYRNGDTFGVGQTLITFDRDGARVTGMRLDSVGGYYPLKRKPSASQ